MKRVFLGVVIMLIVAGSVMAHPLFDTLNGSATTFGAGTYYNATRMPYTADIYVGAGQCLEVSFSGLSNDVETHLLCDGDSDTGTGGALAAIPDTTGYCVLVIIITDASPVSDDFDITVDRNTGTMCP